MEIPEICMISNFEAGMKCLQTPSLISRFLPLSGIEKVPQGYNFWKWGAVIIAILATFSSILKRLKLLIIHIRRIKPSSDALLQHLDLDLDLSDEEEDDDDDGDETSGNSSDDEEDEPTTSFRYRMPGDADFCVKGSGHLSRKQCQNGNSKLRRRIHGARTGEGLSWIGFPAGKNVVKLWDSLGLSLGFDSFEDFDTESVVSLWDFNKEQKINDIFCGSTHFPAVTVAAPSRSVVLSAKKNEKINGKVILGAYDTRMKGQVTAAYAEWSLHSTAPAKVISDGPEKVYVRDDVTGVVTVGDMRKLKKPLDNLTDTDGDLWWDADAVIPDE